MVWLACSVPNPVPPFQRIQTISATDPDEPLGGHRFFFNLAQEAAGKANFSVRDNKGDAGLAANVLTSPRPPPCCGNRTRYYFQTTRRGS